MSGLIAAAITVTLVLARKDKNREIRERQAAEVRMRLDAHMNLWRGLRQMEGLAMKMPDRPLSGERHVLLADDFRWLRDVLRNESLMLASEIHDEYVEFLKKTVEECILWCWLIMSTQVLTYTAEHLATYTGQISPRYSRSPRTNGRNTRTNTAVLAESIRTPADQNVLALVVGVGPSP